MEPTTESHVLELSTQLEDGHTYAEMPPIVDGAPVLTPAQPPRALPLAEWICLRGPCRHYHGLQHTVDAQKAWEPETKEDGEKNEKAGQRATHWGDGTEIKDPVAHVHVCYPSPGVEITMQDENVTECNRWDPEDPDDFETRLRDARREKYRLRVIADADRSSGG
jgi:hypothetical protein